MDQLVSPCWHRAASGTYDKIPVVIRYGFCFIHGASSLTIIQVCLVTDLCLCQAIYKCAFLVYIHLYMYTYIHAQHNYIHAKVSVRLCLIIVYNLGI
jgi:hypothetical protein